MYYSLAVLFVDGFGEWNVHGTDFDAVLRVSAVGDTVLTHNAFEPFVATHLAGGMHIEEPHLRNGLRTDVLIPFILRAGFQAATARHAA